jgi:hypothetical protein
MNDAPTVGLFALNYCTSRMMDVPTVYWPMMPNVADLAVMYDGEKRVRSLYAADQHRAKTDPWRHIRPLPQGIFNMGTMNQDTWYEFLGSAEVDQNLPDRPRLGFENTWAVAEARALPPHNLHAQQQREVVKEYGMEYQLQGALNGARAAGNADDVAAAEAALQNHQSWMMRRQIIHGCEDLRERLCIAQWAEDAVAAKRIAQNLDVMERLANAQRLRAEARERGDKDLEKTYTDQEYEIRRESEVLALGRKLDECRYATAKARATGDAEKIAACAEVEAKTLEKYSALLSADDQVEDKAAE